METDLTKLKELCDSLGGEEWKYQRTSIHSNGYVVNQKGQTVINVSTGDVPAKYCRFIEAADPATVLRLIRTIGLLAAVTGLELDENGNPVGFIEWYERQFASQPYKGASHVADCESAWRAALESKKL